MPRGDFGKAFSRHRQEGGLLSRKEFADKWNLAKGIKKEVTQDEAASDGEQEQGVVPGSD